MPRSDRPNILMITTDQQHYSLLGSVNPAIKTPNLDRLAKQGTRFDRAYCPNPLCTPTRGTLITGQYPSRHGGWTIGTKIPEKHEGGGPFVGDLLRRAGYESHLIGKAHFQPLKDEPDRRSIESQPTLRQLDFWRQLGQGDGEPWYGFDRVDTARMHTAEAHAGGHYAIWLEERGVTDWQKYFNLPGPDGADSATRYRGNMVWDLPEEHHYNHWIAEKTNAHVKRCADSGTPFFTWASFFDPHPPYVVPDPWYSMYDPADMPLPPEPSNYPTDDLPPTHKLTREAEPDFSPWKETPHSNHGYQAHRADDRDQVAKDLAVYYGMMTFTDHAIGKILDHLDATGQADNTLVVFSTDHGHYVGHKALTAKGAFHYEDGVRVPMIARWPGEIPAGKTTDDLQSLVDWVPSFVDAAGMSADHAFQGKSRLANWRGQGDARTTCRVENRHQPTKVHLRTFVTAEAKITLYAGESYGELYDLVADPDERKNLWDHPEAAALKARMLEAAMQEVLDSEPLMTPRVAGA